MSYDVTDIRKLVDNGNLPLVVKHGVAMILESGSKGQKYITISDPGGNLKSFGVRAPRPIGYTTDDVVYAFNYVVESLVRKHIIKESTAHLLTQNGHAYETACNRLIDSKRRTMIFGMIYDKLIR